MSLVSVKKFYFNRLPTLFFLLGFVFLFLAFGPLVKDEIWFKLKELKSQEYKLEDPSSQSDSAFARFLSTRPVSIEPVNKDFSIVIEKIGVNVPINADVTVTNEKEYNKALKEGVAHAMVSDYPSERPGNVYLFAHASVNFWELGKYAKVFNLLRKLELKDRVHIFYKGDTFVYEVVNKEKMKGWNTYPLIRPVIEPTLTLQTCDPPGTTFNRLVVTANLIEVR